MYRFRLVNQYVAKLNYFDDDGDDEHSKRNQVLSTRLYIILLIVILLAFTLYTSLSKEKTVVTLSTPTQSQYEELQLRFSNTMQCPCQDISISYETFISIQPYYHQICSSDFVSQRWIDYLFHENTSYYYQLDFRHSGSTQFQALRTLCEQAQQTIDDSLTNFNSMQFITSQLVSINTFTSQSDSFIQIFKQTTPPLFLNIVELFRQMTINNRLFSGMETNYVLEFDQPPQSNLYLVMDNIYYYEGWGGKYNFDCYSGPQTTSKLQEGIYTNLNRYDYAGSNWQNRGVNATTSMINATVILPGMFIGCLPIESLMQTTTECFFEETCLNQIISYINYSTISLNSFSVLNASRFPPETTIETLVNELFIEEWSINTSFAQYFIQCQPSFCRYTNEEKHNAVYVLTMIISLYGGLKLVLSFLVPIIVSFCRKKKQQQETSTDDTSLSADAPANSVQNLN